MSNHKLYWSKNTCSIVAQYFYDMLPNKRQLDIIEKIILLGSLFITLQKLTSTNMSGSATFGLLGVEKSCFV